MDRKEKVVLEAFFLHMNAAWCASIERPDFVATVEEFGVKRDELPELCAALIARGLLKPTAEGGALYRFLTRGAEAALAPPHLGIADRRSSLD